MFKLKWDEPQDRKYEFGVNHCALFKKTGSGYSKGVAWSGVSSIAESPDGVEISNIYADNKKYLQLVSPENYKGTIEAYSIPEEFYECDGYEKADTDGLMVGMQRRKRFGLVYETVFADESGMKCKKIHFIWNAAASPAEKQYSTKSDTIDPAPFSYEFSTIPDQILVNKSGKTFKALSHAEVVENKVPKGCFDTLENFIFGTETQDPSMPTIEVIFTILGGFGIDAVTVGGLSPSDFPSVSYEGAYLGIQENSETGNPQWSWITNIGKYLAGDLISISDDLKTISISEEVSSKEYLNNKFEETMVPMSDADYETGIGYFGSNG